MDKDSWRRNNIRIYKTVGEYHLCLNDGEATGGCHHGIEVARGVTVGEVSSEISCVSVHESNVGYDAAFQKICLTIKILMLFSLGDGRAHPCFGIETGNPSAARSQAFRQCSLRNKFHL